MLAPFIRTNSGVHYSLDRADLLKFYDSVPEDVCHITSPGDLAIWEVLRERHNISDPEAIPCDLFLWGIGDPPDGRLTRVGGTPWLPRGTPWPVIDGVVLSFLCQFDFRDSQDIVRDVPADLLLVFVVDEDAMVCGDAERMRFIWVSADETDVIAPTDVPKPTNPFEHVIAWGVRCRNVDVPSCWDRASEIHGTAQESDSLCALPVLWGTKIGGVPFHSQDSFDEVPAGYLCQLVSIQPSADTPWPWVNQKSPLDVGFENGGIYHPKNQLMIGDLGELTFYRHRNGSVRVETACG